MLAARKRLDPKLVKELEQATSSAIEILDTSFSALVTGDIDAANDTIDSRSRHQKLIDALAHRVATRKGEEPLALGTIVDSLGRVASYSTDIAEQAINVGVLLEAKGP